MRTRLAVTVMLSWLLPATASAQIKLDDLLDHCYRAGKPDELCVGFVEATTDAMLEYGLWIAMKHYEPPPGDAPLCMPRGNATSQKLVAILIAYVARHPNLRGRGLRASPFVMQALSDAFPCKK